MGFVGLMELFSNSSGYAGNPVEEQDMIARALIKKGKKVIKINRGDPAVYFKTPKYIVDAYVKALRNNRSYYEYFYGAQELREAVAARYRRMYSLSLNVEEDIIVTNGVSEALIFLNNVLMNRGDRAVMFKPFYTLYINLLEISGGKAVYGNYNEKDNWLIDLDHLRRTLRGMKRLKYMLITNPNNPTGTVLGRKTIKEVVDIANENDLILVSDEIYDEILFNNAKFTSLAQLAKGTKHAILNGASKNLDSPGFRMGYIIIPGDDKVSSGLKELVVKYAQMRLSVNTPAQYAVAEGMNNIKEHRKAMSYMVGEMADRANFTYKLINESKYMEAVKPNGAFYVFPKLNIRDMKIKDDTEFTRRLLLEANVQVTRGSGFGSKNHIRIVTLPDKNIIQEAMDRIEGFCRKNKREA